MSIVNNSLLFAGDEGYSIARSVRLRSSASGYFNRTPASAGNRRTWTWSGWVKRGTLGTAQWVFDAFQDGNNFTAFFFNADNTFGIQYFVASTTKVLKYTTQVFRDPSAWYHIVVAIDTTPSTPTFTLYVNGLQVTSFGTNTNTVSQNEQLFVNSTNAHNIGRYGGSANYFDGYLTEINFIDGQALTPSSFGETDSITGVWKAKKYSGTYGTNGFYLNFSDNSNNTAATIGKDYSGNGNNWTPNNISVTSGATYDSMTDVPTLTSATAANYAVMNPLQTGSYATLSNANLRITGNTATNAGGSLSTIGSATGKWYYEAVVSSTGSSHMGVVTYWAGNMANLIDENNVYGASGSNKGIGVRGIGTTYGNAAEKQTISAFTFAVGDIVGIAIDADNGAVYFSVNGNWLNSGVPTSGASRTGSFHNWTPSNDRVCYPAASGYNGGYVDANFGQQPFTYTPPTGFVALNTYNLPASTIKNGADYMAATVYSGNSPSSQTVSNAVNGFSFQPDLVWQKSRTQTYSNVLYDSVRGVQKRLSSNETAAESTASTAVTAFTSSGFTTGADGEMNDPTGGSNNHVAWMWKAGGTSASNTNGTITSTVSVGATQGFSVVTYTGTGANATVGHGLGVAPSLIIAKSRSISGAQWPVYTPTTGSSAFINLDSTAAVTTGNTSVWQGVNPTSTVFSVSTSNQANGSGATYVAYCWAAVAGYSAFGSYTGNGSADGPFVYTGFRPRWVMWKRTDSTSSWTIYDTTRSTYNAVGVYLVSDSSGVEGTYNAYDFTANGIKLRGTDASINASGGTYIYMAFAENPLKYALAR